VLITEKRTYATIKMRDNSNIHAAPQYAFQGGAVRFLTRTVPERIDPSMS